MKKLMQLLAALTVAGASASTAVACSNSNGGGGKNNIKDTNYANNASRDAPKFIISKITNTDISVPYNTNPDTTNQQTINALNQALWKANSSLTSQDLSTLSYSKATLVADKAVRVTVTSKYSDAQDPQASIVLNVALTGKPIPESNIKPAMYNINPSMHNITPGQDTPKAVINKIKNKNISVPKGTNPSTTNPATVTALNQALQTANPTLTSQDLTTLSYSSTTLEVGQAVSVTVTSQSTGAPSAQANLQVTLATQPAPPQKWTNINKAQDTPKAVIAKIKDTNISVPNGTNPSTTNPATVITLCEALQSANPSLNNHDLSTLSYSSATLVVGQAVNVTVISQSTGAPSAQTNLQVTLANKPGPTPQGPQAVIDKITNPNLTLYQGVNPDTHNASTLALLIYVLRQDNPKLTDADMGTLAFAQATLTAGAVSNVNITSYIGTQQASKVLHITLSASPIPNPATPNDILAYVINNNLSVPAGTKTSFDDPTTTALLKTKLKAANPWLTDWMLAKMTFNGVLVAGKAVAGQIIIDPWGHQFPGTKKLVVTLETAFSPKQVIDGIKTKDITVPTGTDPDTSNPDTIAALQQAIVTANPALPLYEAQSLSFAKATLIAGQAVSVQATSNVSGQTSASTTLNITLFRALPIDQAIDQNMVNNNYYIAASNNPSVTNETTRASIFNAIRYNNSFSMNNTKNIKTSDASEITFSGPALQPGVAVDITANIGNGKYTKAIKVTLQKQDPSYKHFVSPFVDVLAWPTYNLATLIKQNVKNATLAFIQNVTAGHGVTPAWGGLASLEIGKSTSEQMQGLTSNLKAYKAAGGNYAISLGGASGQPIWAGGDAGGATVEAITNALKLIVTTYSPDRLDYDIEGAELTDTAGLVNLAQASNNIQKEFPNLTISLTVASDANESAGINPLFAKPFAAMGNAFDKMPIINVMAMDFGSGWTGQDMGDGAIKTAQDTANTTSSLFAKAKFGLSGQDVLNQYFGITPMLGLNDTRGQIFFKYDAMKVAAWANQNHVKWIGYWDANSDFAALNPTASRLGWQVDLSNSGLYQETGDFASIWNTVFGNQS